MASIKGVELKGYKRIKGHDGQGFEANIYLDNTKIGSVFDDGWGGPLDTGLDSAAELFKQRREAYFDYMPLIVE